MVTKHSRQRRLIAMFGCGYIEILTCCTPVFTKVFKAAIVYGPCLNWLGQKRTQVWTNPPQRLCYEPMLLCDRLLCTGALLWNMLHRHIPSFTKSAHYNIPLHLLTVFQIRQIGQVCFVPSRSILHNADHVPKKHGASSTCKDALCLNNACTSTQEHRDACCHECC